MEANEKVEYYQRLRKPYKKRKETKFFIDQFLRGAGSELNKKFWSDISSARLCFDMYSWLANEESVLDVEFEYKLPGIISDGKEIPANMDVYIETASEIWFIESKYTELVNNSKYSTSLPEAYWKSRPFNRDKTMEGSWYDDAKHKKEVNYDLLNRFRIARNPHNEDVVRKMARFFPGFCEDVSILSPNCTGCDWFDAKQETCHLFGLLFYIIENKNRGKQVHFANVVYRQDAQESKTEFATQFENKARTLINEIVGDKLSYDIHWLDELIEKYGGRTCFGLNCNVKEIYEQRYKGRRKA